MGEEQRRYSVKNARRHGLLLMEGKRTQSNYEASGMAPIEEECFTDSVEAKQLASKDNRAKIRYANTYRLESHNKFRDYLVRDKVQEILTNKLQQAKYDGDSSPSLCVSLSDEILKAVKEFNFDRYKYVVLVQIVEKTGQAINVASRCVWDDQRDTWVSAKCETETFIALAVVMACYYD
ncbi:dynein light chain Tctex-type protein 2-like isoform X1 [Tyto alba]|uniref:dynein light chain Tctex-type protein 2-like isoform X1 n=1 Tax=Tyto alba TaxID=56313 RepID=UPI001C673EC7|nr:dynein light chain Tctex-type protein 2-like isoform X1 [Tyto alba]XP_042651698.1 dynein light chain Tctex-type protein 2-like isoform X1 [Tyto alba]